MENKQLLPKVKVSLFLGDEKVVSDKIKIKNPNPVISRITYEVYDEKELKIV